MNVARRKPQMQAMYINQNQTLRVDKHFDSWRFTGVQPPARWPVRTGQEGQKIKQQRLLMEYRRLRVSRGAETDGKSPPLRQWSCRLFGKEIAWNEIRSPTINLWRQAHESLSFCIVSSRGSFLFFFVRASPSDFGVYLSAIYYSYFFHSEDNGLSVFW